MIVTRTPFRVSLFGGGTDYPAWFKDHEGEVLGFSIDKYCWITLRKLPPFFDYKHRLVYSQIELVKDCAEIKHPAAREIMRLFDPNYGIELHHDGDLPARSGLGSSSSFAVGLFNAMYALQGKHVTKQALAEAAIHIEREVLNENVGSQDQIWAAYGGFNRIAFRSDGTFEVHPVIVHEQRRRELSRSLMLFFTGQFHSGTVEAGKQIANFGSRERHLKHMREMVSDAMAILHNDRIPLSEIGLLLHDSWKLKRELSDSVTNAKIDLIYDAGRSAGALGGKLLGAGGGGFMLFYVPPLKQQAVRQRLSSLINVSFDISQDGSRVMLYEPEGL